MLQQPPANQDFIKAYGVNNPEKTSDAFHHLIIRMTDFDSENRAAYALKCLLVSGLCYCERHIETLNAQLSELEDHEKSRPARIKAIKKELSTWQKTSDDGTPEAIGERLQNVQRLQEELTRVSETEVTQIAEQRQDIENALNNTNKTLALFRDRLSALPITIYDGLLDDWRSAARARVFNGS